MEDSMAGLVPVRRSREELDQANDSLLKEHRAYLASWIARETVTAQENSDKEAESHKSSADDTVLR